MDIKTTLRDEVSWSNAALASKLQLQELNYVATVYSWKRQRDYIAWALEALGRRRQGVVLHKPVYTATLLTHIGSQPAHHAAAYDALQALRMEVLSRVHITTILFANPK